jgi:hypothetical protein
VTAVVALAVGLAAQGAPNFSGTWALDQAKSQMPQMGGGRGGPGGGGGPMTITQTAADLTIERQGGQGVMKTAYKLDGSESVNTTGRGESKSTCKWDGAKLVVKTVSSFQGPQGAMTMESTAVYSLSADGKVLTVEQTRQSPQGEVKSTMVYNKQ